MRLWTALNKYKRDRGGRFLGECRIPNGAFSDHGDRFVYVGLDGSLRDYSVLLPGLYGIDRSRFGIETDGETHWFDELESVRRYYYWGTSLVETEYDAGEYIVHQYDLAFGRAYMTHAELCGAISTDARLAAFLTLAPEGRETWVGRLIHEAGSPNDTQTVKVFHRNEHDYVTASIGLTDVRGQIPERFDGILSDDTFDFPRETVLNRCEDIHLSGDVVVSAPLEQEGRAARTILVTQFSNHNEMARTGALADLRYCSVQHTTANVLRGTVCEQAEVLVPDGTPREQTVRADLRALSLLAAPNGARIASPELDPFYAHPGDYGYTWFRDDAEVTQVLAHADDVFGLDLGDRLVTSAEPYC